MREKYGAQNMASLVTSLSSFTAAFNQSSNTMVLPLSRSNNITATLSPQPQPNVDHHHHHHHGNTAADQHKAQPRHAAAAAAANNTSNTQTHAVEPTTALSLLNHSRQQDVSRLCLLLPPPNYNNNNNNNTHLLLPLSLGITELFGTAGVGKTQIGLSTCVSCVCTSTTTTTTTIALYITLGEGSTRAKIAQRLHQMASLRSTTTSTKTLLQHILTRTMRNEDEFLNFCMHELPLMLQSSNIRVVVLDSMAGMFRVCSRSCFPKRSFLLFQIATQLKLLSDQYKVPILCINQVTTNINTNTIVPALGVSWSQCVNTSYRVERSEQQETVQENVRGGAVNAQQEQSSVFVRCITLVRSSSLSPFSVPFRIDASGVVAVRES